MKSSALDGRCYRKDVNGRRLRMKLSERWQFSRKNMTLLAVRSPLGALYVNSRYLDDFQNNAKHSVTCVANIELCLCSWRIEL